MQIMETDHSIRQLKAHLEGERLRLTFQWPPDVQQVYIFRTVEEALDIATADWAQAKLFTLQEYKKQGGYVEAAPAGAFTYHLYPFLRQEGEDIILVCADSPDSPDSNKAAQNTLRVTGPVVIQFSVREKAGLRDKTHKVELLSPRKLDGDVLCYVKKTGGYPASVADGTLYFFGDGLEAGLPLRCEIKTRKDEYIRIFVRDAAQSGAYILKMG